MMPRAAAIKPASRQPRSGLINPAYPLRVASREHFAQLVAKMTPVPEAYRLAGYTGGDQSRSELRRSIDVDDRISWLLADRVKADTALRHRGEKKVVDLRLKVLRELERVAFASARDVVQWQRVPILDASGSVQGYRDEMVVTPSHQLTADQAASVKSVTTKSGSLKIDMHDKLNALTTLAKSLGILSDAAPVQSVTVNQVNVGDVNALEAARRLAFIMGRAASSAPLIEGETVKTADTPE